MNSASAHYSPGTQPGCFSWRQLAQQWLALLVVFSLGLSSLGPMLDHHFAERHPGHGHFYFGAAAADHSHSYDLSHPHDTLSALLGEVAVPDDPGVDGVVIFSPNAGIGAAAADLTLPLTPPSFAGFGDGAGPLTAGDTRGAALTSRIIAPPTRPPLA